jgi:mRNA interferase MazF
MRRGEIRVADLEPVRGSEADKRRPVVVVSNDAANRRAESLGRGVITVVPLTSNVSRVLPFQVMVPPNDSGLSRPSKAQAEQVRSVAVERLGARVGRLPPSLVDALDTALRLHLQL